MPENLSSETPRSRVHSTIILSAFKPILEAKHTFYVYHSGRGYGKSYGILQSLAIFAAQNPNTRILCIREIQSSIAESVKSELERVIGEMGLESLFTYTREEVRCINGSQFIFRGMQTARAVNIKSISNIRITFCEEAEALSEHSLDILMPSVLRRKEKDAMMIFALNPRFAEDAVYARFLSGKPPPSTFVRKLTEADNPFFKESQLYTQMLHDRETMPPKKFAWMWLGELMDSDDDCIFSDEAFKLMKSPRRAGDEFVKIVVGCDPAMTNKEFSNRYGIVVAGITQSGVIVMLENRSANLTPHEFAKETAEAVEYWDAECAVVETNAGGDFIKATLLMYNPSLYVVEVRATQSKVDRAMPLANLAALGKVRVPQNAKGANDLLREMRLTTTRGFTGRKGESPDCLDAFVWASAYLNGWTEKNTQGSVFNASLFTPISELGDYSFIESSFDVISYYNDELCRLNILIKSNAKTQKCFIVQKCQVYERNKLESVISECQSQVFLLNSDGVGAMLERLMVKNAELQISLIDPLENDLDSEAVSAAQKLNSVMVCIETCETAVYDAKSYEGNILDAELRNFALETTKWDVVVETFVQFMRII